MVTQERKLSPQRKGPGNMYDKFGRIYLTDNLPGIGGRIKDRPEDFVVEEIPLYDFSDQGNFALLLLEKINLSTLDLVALIRKQLDLRDEEVGLAGWKDKRAITSQWVSVPREKASESRLAQLAGDGIKILQIRHHTNKLRTGHLLGNRFTILIRQADAEAENRAQAIIQQLQTLGLPNFYGPQRFGAAGDNPEKGLALLLGQYRLRSVRKRKLLVSSYNSLLFNLTLKERMEKDLFAKLLQGDIAKKHDTGGIFLVSDPKKEQQRADRLEISATGPIWGKKMKRAGNEAAALEERILSSQGLTPDVFRKQPGSRRFLRIALKEVNVCQEKEGLRLEFFLPKGSYATVLLDEIMKA
ncbi:MAG: tRNA pseudouridine(13) synthase TruD [Deltaproteobacteria bacterium]|nr:tRNA pseudouridine(13) synthase TruD [Deltaproteobacteria bacterium]